MKSGNTFALKTLPDVLIRNSAASNISSLSLWTGVKTDRQTAIITACFTPKVLTARSADSLLAQWKMTTAIYTGTETNWNNGFPIKCARLWQGWREGGRAGLIILAASAHAAVPTWWNYNHCTGLSGHQTGIGGLENGLKYFANQRNEG